jgi:ankyrin repeat protein
MTGDFIAIILSRQVRNNQAALVRLLLPAGADFRRRLTPRNETMLLHSLIKHCVPPVDAALNLFPDAQAAGEIFEALFERATKDDVNAFDFNRTTPLLCATRVGNATLMNR